MKIIKICSALILIAISNYSLAENLGVYGQVYTITEPDLLSSIHAKLLTYQQDGKLTEMETNLKNRAEQSILRPTPVSNVQSVSTNDKTIISYYTPSLTIQHNIVDQNGKILFPSGTIINPLDPKITSKISPNTFVPQFNETLFFINADQTQQIAFIKNAIQTLTKKNPFPAYKIILVQGNLKKASNQLGRIYFDQDGTLCRLFHIHRVPAVVVRNGVRLKITEQVIHD